MKHSEFFMRNILLSILFIFTALSMHAQICEYDSLENIDLSNILKMKGQTLHYPSYQPMYSYLFYKKPGGSIFKEDNWMNLTPGFTKEKYVSGKHFYIKDIVKYAEKDYYYECEIVESKKKVYIRCSSLFADGVPIMYIVGHFEKMKQIHVGKRYIVKSSLYDTNNYNERKEFLKRIKFYKGVGFIEFFCTKVTISSTSKHGLIFTLYNPEGLMLPVVLMEKYCVDEAVVDQAVADKERRERARQEEQEQKRLAELLEKARVDSLKTLLKKDLYYKTEYFKKLNLKSLEAFIKSYGRERALIVVHDEMPLNKAISLIKKYGPNTFSDVSSNSLKKVNWDKFEINRKKYGLSIAKDMAKGYVSIGWSKSMAEESWGKPEKINRTIGRWGSHEQWVYGSGCYLYFENGKLTTIQN